jgi:hypothetical protein
MSSYPPTHCKTHDHIGVGALVREHSSKKSRKTCNFWKPAHDRRTTTPPDPVAETSMPYTAPQRTNAAWKQEMLDGAMKLGCAINASSTLVAELCAAIGYDFLLLDAQHSAVDPERLRGLIQAAHAGGAKTMVRVGGAHDRIGIQQALDLGSDAILVPCSRTVEDVRHAISCAKYPVAGPGSEGGSRSVYMNIRPQFPGGFGGLCDYVNAQGNAESIVAVQARASTRRPSARACRITRRRASRAADRMVRVRRDRRSKPRTRSRRLTRSAPSRVSTSPSSVRATCAPTWGSCANTECHRPSAHLSSPQHVRPSQLRQSGTARLPASGTVT